MKMYCCHRFLVLILSIFTISIAAHGSDLDMPRVTWQDLMDLEIGHEPVLLEGLMLEDNRPIEILLEPFTILSDIGVVVLENREGSRFLQEEDLVHLYRGHVLGRVDSQVFLGATEKHINGFIRSSSNSYHLSTGAYSTSKAEQIHITPFEGSLKDWSSKGPFCNADDIEQPFAFHIPAIPARGIGSDPTCTIIELAVDSDWEYTSSLFGGDAEASAAYALALAGAVSEIYITDMQVKIEVTYLRTWEDNSDPYDPYDSGYYLLDQFRDHWNAEMTSVDRDVAHLLSSPFSGGVAWLSVLCNTDWGYAVSGSLQGSFPYPLEDNSHQNWDLIVVAHELGHNFGTPHTHDLGIDGCGLGDCTDAHLGTIMSYCHLCAGGLSNISLSFHELCQDIMYDMFDSTSCDSSGDCVTCTGDIDGSGAIGVDDLLSIIAAWGGNDADADLNEDGIVGVDDLLIVISDWGPCP